MHNALEDSNRRPRKAQNWMGSSGSIFVCNYSSSISYLEVEFHL